MDVGTIVARVQILPQQDHVLILFDRIFSHLVLCKSRWTRSIDFNEQYPVTVLGVLDAGEQFNLVVIAVSNKEDEEIYTSFV